MGDFYNPPQDVVEGHVGRQIELSSDHIKALGQLTEGEHLYIGLDRGSFWAVGCVDDPREFEAASEAIPGAFEVRMFALPDEAHQRAIGS